MIARKLFNNGNKFSGNYASWAEAQTEAVGYDSDVIIEKVYAAALKVKKREAVYERDGVCYYAEAYRWPVLTNLLLIAAANNGRLNVLDFGGALGGFYSQHMKYLNQLNSVQWCVVEQAKFVVLGKQEFETPSLRFFSSIEECAAEKLIDIVFISSVLQYLELPEHFLTNLSKLGVKYILIDRTPMISENSNRLTIQKVPKSIYHASYPAWFFSNSEFIKLTESLGYKIIDAFQCDDEAEIGEYKGCLLERV